MLQTSVLYMGNQEKWQAEAYIKARTKVFYCLCVCVCGFGVPSMRSPSSKMWFNFNWFQILCPFRLNYQVLIRLSNSFWLFEFLNLSALKVKEFWSRITFSAKLRLIGKVSWVLRLRDLLWFLAKGSDVFGRYKKLTS